MVLTRSTARRYAEAGFEVAVRDDSMEVWLAAFDVAEARLLDAAVMRLLGNPAIPMPSRIAALERILGDDVDGPSRNLLALMVRRNRVELLPGVAREFRRLYRARAGIVEATVTSTTRLEDAELESLRERLATLTGRTIELRSDVDPALLGGIQVRVGDRLIDGSVRGRLQRLRTDFSNLAI